MPPLGVGGGDNGPGDSLECDAEVSEFLDEDEQAALLGKGYSQSSVPAVECSGRFQSWRKHGSAVMTSHAEVLSLFCSARYRVPMLVVWITALGGAMHEPAVPYFYLSLGLSAAQIGQAGGILTAGSLLLAPFYGWIFDRHSALLALVLGISLCGGGCLLRALATGPATVLLSAVVMSVDGSFESLVLAYVARDQRITESDNGCKSSCVTKAAVISAFLAQVQLMRIVGRGLYPAWNWSVRRLIRTEHSGDQEPGAGVGSSQLLRYRIVLASCVVPCVIGFFALLWLCCTSAAVAGNPGQIPRGVHIPMQNLPDASRHPDNSRGNGAVHHNRDRFGQPVPIAKSTCIAVALVVALVAQGAVMALTYTLWPLFLRVHYDVDDGGFAPLLFASSVAAVMAVLLAPTLQKHVPGGALQVATIAACTAGVATPAAFAVQCPHSSLLAHTLLVLVSFASVAVLEAALKSAASELASRSCQGSAFGLVASLTGIGSVSANVFGTVLYEHSFAEHSGLDESVSHSVLEHGVTLRSLNGTAATGDQEWWCDHDRGTWATFVSFERIVAGLGGLLPFHVVGVLLLLSASGLALAR